MTEKFLCKVPFVGDGGVGKTSITQRITGQGFNTSYLMTIGADFKLKQLVLDDGTEVTLQLWDTAGQQRFTSIRSFFYTGSRGIVLVYDVTRPQSFHNLKNWYDEIKKHVYDGKASLLVIGNKTDLIDQRQVSKDEGYRFATSIDANFAEASAKTGQGIDEAILRFARTIVSKFGVVHPAPTEVKGKSERKLMKTTVHPLLLDDGEVILFELEEELA